MALSEKKKSLFDKFKDMAFVCDNIPCYVQSKNDIYPSVSRCPKCGHKMMNVCVSSPVEYWQHLCGREGCITICDHCGEQGEFKLLKMN